MAWRVLLAQVKRRLGLIDPLWPPCSKCGSDGHPADLQSTSSEHELFWDLTVSRHAVHVSSEPVVTGYECASCWAASPLAQENLNPEEIARTVREMEALRLDPEMPSWRAKVTPRSP